jgi:lysophospholipase L1-like esterase
VNKPLPYIKKSFLGFFLVAVVFVFPLRAQSYPKWLAIGDSITQHGPKAELKWEEPVRGMAASSLQSDYVHVLRSMMQRQEEGNASEVKIVGRLGKLGAGTMEQMETVVGELRDWGADLVTIQLGENDHLKEIGAEGFGKRYRALVDGIFAGAKRPRILCTGVWVPGGKLGGDGRYLPGTDGAIKEDIIEKICREKNLTFVSVARFASKTENFGAGETSGVKWHPNDAGMRAYAASIFEALYRENAAQ